MATIPLQRRLQLRLPVFLTVQPAWGDYDNDCYLDILLTGTTRSGTATSKIYHNNGNNTFTEQTSISLTGIFNGSAAGAIMIMTDIWIFF